MTHFHMAIWLDHEKALVVSFNADDASFKHLHAKHAAHHGHAHPKLADEFVADMVEAITQTERVILMGPGSARDELKQIISQKHAKLLAKIVAVEKADHMTDREVLAHARQKMAQIDRMLPTG